MDVTFALIEAAEARIGRNLNQTPLLSSPHIDALAGRHILVKAENLQKTGSFKARGGWSAVSALSAAERARGVVAFSSGNHAQGVAYAARQHDVSALIVMPKDAPAAKVAGTRALGAEVLFYDRATEDRDAIGHQISQERGLVLIRPYDEPLVIAGQATVGLEIAAQAAELGVEAANVLVPCGGGGLTSGVALALAARAPAMQVRPVEPAGFDDVTRSLVSGKIETNIALSGSICDAILTPSPGEITFPIIKEHCGPGIVVSDDEARAAMAAAFRYLRLVLEPGGAASLAAALYHPDQISGDTTIVLASGGNVDAPLFAKTIMEAADDRP